ncbi:MAG TPA: hypothetical protein VGG19_17485 [Tepidisphaeraceae bacterium]|jgi:hypothetical protein
MRQCGFSRARRIKCLSAIAAAAFLALATNRSPADSVQLAGGYHAQVTNYFCAAASVEMALDTPAVTNANPIVAQLIAAGDGGTVAAGTPTPIAGINFNNGFGTVTAGSAQAFIYGLNHGLNTVNAIGYYNVFSPPGSGTDSQGVDADLNLLDNPNWNGVTNPAWAFGSHQYAGYNLASQGLANRTIANALSQYQVPAVVAINSGGHAISVYGVETNGAIAPNQNYTVTGVYVHDPWTGWAVQQQNGGNFNPALLNANGGLGLGYNTYLAYGVAQAYTIDQNGVRTNLPNGKLKPWTKIFNVSPGQITPSLQYTAPGYKFEVEPQGPELPDTGDPAGDDGIPGITSDLASAITNASTADADALSDLSADSALQSDIELAGGNFDIADATMMQAPGESSTEGDWLIPYDGSGGINDVTGAIFIDSETGGIDEATWIDPTDSTEVPYTLSQIDTMFQDIDAGDLPNDDPPVVPEPTALAMLIPLAALLRRRR